MRRVALSIALAALALAAACTTEAPAPARIADAGASGELDARATEDGSVGDAAPSDASDGGGPDGGCAGACATTAVTVTVGTKSGPFTRAQHGFNATDGAAPTAHVEVHFGGDPACPSQTSPTPDRTAVIANVPLALGEFTQLDGVRATLLDFNGAVTSQPLVRADTVKVKVVSVKTSPKSAAVIAFDLDVTFPGGTMSGHVYAPHCDSMDD